MKRVTGTYSARPHWVGDGFPARSMFSYNTHGQHLSPFLLLDYAGPYTFAPSDTAWRWPASASRFRDRHHRL